MHRVLVDLDDDSVTGIVVLKGGLLSRDVLVPLVLNTVLGFGLYYVVTRDDESCLKALSAFRQLAATLVEPV